MIDRCSLSAKLMSYWSCGHLLRVCRTNGLLLGQTGVGGVCKEYEVMNKTSSFFVTAPRSDQYNISLGNEGH